MDRELRDLWGGGIDSLNRVWALRARKARESRHGEFIAVATQAEPCPFFFPFMLLLCTSIVVVLDSGRLQGPCYAETHMSMSEKRLELGERMRSSKVM